MVPMALSSFELNIVGTVTRKSRCMVVLWAHFSVCLMATALLEWDMFGTSVTDRFRLKRNVLWHATLLTAPPRWVPVLIIYSSMLNISSMAIATYRPCNEALTMLRSAKLRTMTGTELMTTP